MHGLSTILSLIIKLFGKIFRLFGINAILTIMFVIELIGCIGYASEMSDYDSNRTDYEFLGIESVEELNREDPLFREMDILTSESDHFYLVRIKIHNRYSERLFVPMLSAETNRGDMVYSRCITYYGDNMQGHNVYSSIPEGTQTVLTYLLQVSDHRWEETESIELHDISGNDEQSMTIQIPK